MTLEALQRSVYAFFGSWEGASLKLPSGWFGRPHDNFHVLTSVSIVGDALVIVLDERLELRLSRPQRIDVDGPTLRVGGFTGADWKWCDYGTGAEHREHFDGGVVEFVAA